MHKGSYILHVGVFTPLTLILQNFTTYCPLVVARPGRVVSVRQAGVHGEFCFCWEVAFRTLGSSRLFIYVHICVVKVLSIVQIMQIVWLGILYSADYSMAEDPKQCQ